jgi:hypothetical protein
MGYKAKSITSKASSACKMNMALIKGEAKIGAVKKAGIGDLQAEFDAGRQSQESSPAVMRSSPAKLPIAAIAKAAPMILGALGGGKKGGGGGGGGTKVVVNNSADAAASSESNSQAANAIDPK